MNAYGAIAEEQQHHPNLHIVNYRTVIIEMFTFSVQGLAVNDFISKFGDVLCLRELVSCRVFAESTWHY